SVTFQERQKGDAAGTQRGRRGDGEGTETAKAPAAPVVLVPKRAVAEENGQTIVWVVTGNTASRRTVTLGEERIDQIEAKSGVIPGETLILNPPAGLIDRARVRVKGK